ncbi:ATP-binding protein [Methylomonas paludis]|uniref:ATP-binding protein n=1 Tax=Methylomonas paludis TaxID=1173101 RepID=A0A975MQP9_9GAMM|nr:ATP-binding protein [Methylomonas paludis]QWF71999.1 ATP-binding protein [Methylomonas paludis]
MLAQFEVSNFRQFKEKIVLDLTDAKQYAFNPECIRNGLVNKAIIYGSNGCGKTNLGLAIFDIVWHLTDNDRNGLINYMNGYANAESDFDLVKFRYVFKFNNKNIVYEYGKREIEVLQFETLNIDGKLVIEYELGKPLKVNLAGAETLKTDLSNSNISALKYIRSNAVLDKNEVNQAFDDFYYFVERMLFFRSVEQNMFIGSKQKVFTICQDILEHDHLQDFEEFLNDVGVKCVLSVIEVNGQKDIAFKFGYKSIPFFGIASSGTKDLALFYAWYQRILEGNEVSFVYIDEFDAHYHHALARSLVEKLKKVDAQVVLTTHNTNLMTNDMLRPDCYFIMSETGIRPLPQLTLKELRDVHNLEKIYRAGGFDG